MLLPNALSAFVSRDTRGRRGVLALYSAVGTAALFVLSMLVAARAAEDHQHVDALALADMLSMIFVACALLIVAPAVVAAQVGEERRQGTLDLLRTAPLSPTMLTFGFLAGAPSGVYLLCAGPFALHCVATLCGRVPMTVFVESALILGSGAVLLMLLAMLAALTLGRSANAGSAPMMVVGVLAMLALSSVGMAMGAGSSSWTYVQPIGELASIYVRFPGPFQDGMLSSYQLDEMTHGAAAAWHLIEPIFAFFIYVVGTLLVLVAARRSLSGDPPAQLTKVEAVGLFSLAAVAVLVPIRATLFGHLEHDMVGVAVISLVPAYLVCVLGSTPSAIGYGDGSAPGLSPRGAPLTAAALMLASAALLTLGILGPKALDVFQSPATLGFFGAFSALALTLPIYSLFVMTRIGTTAGRLAVVAALVVHFVLQLVSWTRGIEAASDVGNQAVDVSLLLCQIGMVFGCVLPAFVAWRQRVGDRALRSA